MSDKKAKIPQIRFAGFMGEWEERKLGEHAKFRRGSFPQPYGNKEWYDGEGAMPFVQVVDVTDSLILADDTKQKISKLAQPKSVFVPKGKVVVTLQGSIGRVAITQYDSYVDRTLLIFETYVKPTDVYFWAYTIQQKFEIEKQKAPGGTIKTITKEALSSFEVYLPECAEQNKLGAYFANLDNLITLQQRQLDQLASVKKTMLAKMFPKDGANVPEIRFAGFKGAWEERKVKDLFKVTRGNVLAATITSEKKTEDAPYPVYSSQTKQNGLMGYYKEFLYEDAITWTTDGANAGTVNYRAGKFYCTNVCGVLLTNEIKANQMIAEALNNIAKKYVSYVGNPKLMNNVMADIELILPRQEKERDIIASFFCDLDTLLTLHQRELNALKTLKKSMLQQLFV